VTVSRVGAAGLVAYKRFKAYCRVFVTGCVASECLIAVRSVIVPGCVGIERLYLFLSFSPLRWFSGIAGPEEAKNLAGQEGPPPDSNPFSDAEVWRKLRHLVKTIRRKSELPLRVPQTPSAFLRAHDETLSVVAMRVRDKDRSPVGINR
jgi:hypothetical protein